jgi:hypothetical protein
MNVIRIGKKTLTCLILFLTILFPIAAAIADEPAPAAPAGPPAPSFIFSTDFLNQYIFRGVAQTKDSFVIQPSLGLTYCGLTVNLWGNFDAARHSDNPFYLTNPNGTTPDWTDQLGNSKWTETDFTVSYTKELCPNFSATIGNVYYALQAPLSPWDLDELFGGVSYTFPWLTVAFTTYGEVTHSFDIWFQLDLTKSIPVDCLCKGATLDLGASFGYLILLRDDNILSLAGSNTSPPVPLDTGSYSNFHTCQLTADIKFPINKYLSVSPKVGVWLPLTGAATDYLDANSMDTRAYHYYGGINLTASF